MLHSLSGNLAARVGVEGWMAAPGGLGMVIVAILYSSNSSLRRNGKLGKPADRKPDRQIEGPGFAQAGRENCQRRGVFAGRQHKFSRIGFHRALDSYAAISLDPPPDSTFAGKVNFGIPLSVAAIRSRDSSPPSRWA